MTKNKQLLHSQTLSFWSTMKNRRTANFSIIASCALCYIAEPVALAEAPTYSSPDKRVPVTSQGQQSHGNWLHSFRKGYAAYHNEAIRRNFLPLSISKNVSLKPSKLYLALWSHALMTSKDRAGKNTEWCLLTISVMVWQENTETESNGLKKKKKSMFASMHFFLSTFIVKSGKIKHLSVLIIFNSYYFRKLSCHWTP